MTLSQRPIDQHSLLRLKAEVERHIDTITPPGCGTYFTEGSVDSNTSTTGTGFARDIAQSMKVTDNAPSLQAEAVVLVHASRKGGACYSHKLQGSK